MLECAKHQQELLCECKQNTWKQLPPEKRIMAIKITTEALKTQINTDKRGLWLDWADAIKMKILGFKFNSKGEVMKS